MKKIYESPDFEVVRITLSDTILTISEGESGESGGGSIVPGDDDYE